MTAGLSPTRLTITGLLIADSPIHVGGGTGVEIDRPCVVDGAGRWIVPGTSLAGILRDRLPSEYAGKDWWGDAADSHEEAERDAVERGEKADRDADTKVSNGGHGASRIIVDDAVGPRPGDVGVPLSQTDYHVSIDGRWGTARPGSLFSIESVPVGTRFEFRCTIDPPSSADLGDQVRMASQIVELLTGGLTVGARGGSGQGRVRLIDERVTERRRGSRDDLRALMEGAGTARDRVERTIKLPPVASPAGQLGDSWCLGVQALGPVLVAEHPPGTGFDVVPRTHRVGDRVHLIIPGSSMRGVLRAHATRIVRTAVSGRSDGDGSDGNPTPNALLELLFGSTKRRGSLEVRDLLSLRSWSASEWNALLRSDREGRTEALRSTNSSVDEGGNRRTLLIVGDHVAIDRWTGGARKGALYSVLEPWLSGTEDWAPLHIRFSWRSIESNALERAARCLITLVLQDFADGRLGVGYGTTKGYGHVTTTGKPKLDVEDVKAWKGWLTSDLRGTSHDSAVAAGSNSGMTS